MSAQGSASPPARRRSSVAAVSYTHLLPIWEGDKIFFRLLEEEHPYFSLKLVYDGDTLKQAVLDGKCIV